MNFKLILFNVSYPVNYSCEKGNYKKTLLKEIDIVLDSFADIDGKVRQAIHHFKFLDGLRENVTHYELFDDKNNWIMSSYI